MAQEKIDQVDFYKHDRYAFRQSIVHYLNLIPLQETNEEKAITYANMCTFAVDIADKFMASYFKTEAKKLLTDKGFRQNLEDLVKTLE